MINKVALLRLEDICSSGIVFDSELLFFKKPQALQDSCWSERKHKKFMQIYEATKAYEVYADL